MDMLMADVTGLDASPGDDVVILGQLGVSPERALAVSLLAFGIGFVWSLPGALLQFGIRPRTAGYPESS